MNDFTDHCPVLLQLNFSKPSKNDKIKITFRPHSTANKDLFEDKLRNFNWDSLRSEDIDIYLDLFLKTLNRIYCESFPLKVKFVSSNQFSKPWITPQIKNLISCKSKYFQLLKLKIVTPLENNRFKNKIYNTEK